MRFALLATASTLLVGFATLACSGTASTDDGSETPAAENNVNSGSATATPTTGTATSTTTTVDDAGTIVVDASTTNTTDAGTACLADSVRESESNDTTANVVPATTGSFCGRLTANDVDTFSFTMPAQVGAWSVNFDKLIAVDGNVRFGIEADVNGQQFNIQGRWPFVAGGVYTFKLRAGDFSPTTASLDYKVSLNFGQ